VTTPVRPSRRSCRRSRKDGEKCTTFAECKELLEAGEDIDYDGVSGPIEFDDNGDPTKATIGIYEYGPDNKNPLDIKGDVPAPSSRTLQHDRPHLALRGPVHAQGRARPPRPPARLSRPQRSRT
jgi:hypothetical protein